MVDIDFDELKEASKSLVDYYTNRCNLHQSIIIDGFGVRIVSDEAFVPIPARAQFQRDIFNGRL